jgi:hypothetical protein
MLQRVVKEVHPTYYTIHAINDEAHTVSSQVLDGLSDVHLTTLDSKIATVLQVNTTALDRDAHKSLVAGSIIVRDQCRVHVVVVAVGFPLKPLCLEPHSLATHDIGASCSAVRQAKLLRTA